jgi:hypothetical protein
MIVNKALRPLDKQQRLKQLSTMLNTHYMACVYFFILS